MVQLAAAGAGGRAGRWLKSPRPGCPWMQLLLTPPAPAPHHTPPSGGQSVCAAEERPARGHARPRRRVCCCGSSDLPLVPRRARRRLAALPQRPPVAAHAGWCARLLLRGLHGCAAHVCGHAIAAACSGEPRPGAARLPASRVAGTLAKPFFKRRRDGSFFFKSGESWSWGWAWQLGEAAGREGLAGCMWRSLDAFGRSRRAGLCSARSSHRTWPCSPSLTAPPAEEHGADGQEGMGLAVDLTGAAAPGAAEAQEGGAALEEGARILVTFSHFQARLRKQTAHRPCCRALSACCACSQRPAPVPARAGTAPAAR